MPRSKNRSQQSREYRGVEFWRIVVAKINDISETLIPIWLPDGKRQGNKYWARNPTRPDKSHGSFCIVVSGPQKGVWKDFATHDSGANLVSLFCYINGGEHTDHKHFMKSVEILAKMVGLEDQA